jgi:hypothetical protein
MGIHPVHSLWIVTLLLASGRGTYMQAFVYYKNIRSTIN